MSTYQNKTPGNKNQSFSAENTSAETDDNLFEYLDESPVAVAQRKLKDIADNSPKTSEISELQSIANKKFDPVSVSQKKAKKRNPLKELDNTIQLSEDLDNLNDEVRQGKNIRDKRSVGQILTFRNSGYEEFKQGLSDLHRAMTRDPRVIPIEVNKRRIQKKGSDYLLMLRKEHRNRNIEDETT